jgi:WD40 repeat protein
MTVASKKTKIDFSKLCKRILNKSAKKLAVILALATIIIGAYVLSSTSQALATSSNSAITPQNAMQITKIHELNETKNVHQVAWSTDKKWLAAASSNVYIYDAQTLTEVYHFPMNYDSTSSTAMGLTFSPDSKLLAVHDAGGFFIYNADGWGRVFYRANIGVQMNPQSISFSPDGKLLAVAVNSAVQLWNTNDWIVNNTLPAGSPTVVAFSPDGKTIAASGEVGGEDVKIWDYSGKELYTLSGHTNWINSLSFSPDGSILASGSTDKQIWLWNTANGQQIRVLTGHTGDVESVSFSPDGQLLASGSWDLTIRLWDVKTGQNLNSLKGHTGWINSVAFSPDGVTIASGANSDPVLLWGLATSSPSTSPVAASSTSVLPSNTAITSPTPTSSVTLLPTSFQQGESNPLLWYYLIAAAGTIIGVILGVYKIVEMWKSKKIAKKYTIMINAINAKISSKEIKNPVLDELAKVEEKLCEESEINQKDRDRVKDMIKLMKEKIDEK